MGNFSREDDTQKRAPCTFAAFFFTPLEYSQLAAWGFSRASQERKARFLENVHSE
jgi:hypothetical protein